MTAKEEVEAILKRKGWSRWKLANRSGIPTTTISRILDKGKDPRTSTMEKIRKGAKARK